MSSQTEASIKVHQNIALAMGTSNDSPSKKNSSNKKRRVTSSMLHLDEEPVFSDSEEEMKYMKLVFGETSHISPIKPPKNRDVEVQCDIISNEKTLIQLIKRCSLLRPEFTTGQSVIDKYLRELVCLCKLIRSEMHEESADFSDESCNGEDLLEYQFTKNKQTIVVSTPVYASSEEFLPSSCGTYPQDKERLSRSLTLNELVPSEPFVSDEQSPSTDKKKVFKKRRTKTRNNSEKHSTRHSIRESRPPKRKFSTGCFIPNKKQIIEGEKENVKKKVRSGLEKNIKKNSGDKRQRMERITNKSREDLPNRCHPDLENISTSPDSLNLHETARQLVNTDAPLNISIPKKVLKSLARNWMKPNKSFCRN